MQLEKEILPRLSLNNVQQTRRTKIKTQPIVPNFSTDYQTVPSTNIEWHQAPTLKPIMKKRAYSPRLEAYQKRRQSNEALMYKASPLDKEVPPRQIAIPKYQPQQEQFNTTKKKLTKVPRHESLMDIEDTIKKAEKRINTRDDITPRKPQKRPNSRFLRFDEERRKQENPFQFLQQRLQDLRKVDRFYGRTHLNDYRTALQKRRDSKRNTNVHQTQSQRKDKLAMLLAIERQLKDRLR